MKKIKYLLFIIFMFFFEGAICAYAQGNITVSTTNIRIIKGTSSSFKITANNAAGRVDISSSDSTVATVSTSSLFLDMQTETVTVKGNKIGNTTITVYLSDATTYDEESLTGKQYIINVVVYEPEIIIT